eukprot:SAG11_NODE_6904_length_1228_cov_1.350753_2_plen_216_part_00
MQSDGRRVVVEGATPHEQGVALGQAARERINHVFTAKVDQYRAIPGAMERWETIASAAEATMQEHTPHTYAELVGQAEGAGLETRALMLMATEYELSMSDLGARAAPPMGDKCTGVLAHRGGDRGGGVVLIGQNNDENRLIWDRAELDIIAELRQPAGRSACSDVLLYTHPGIPAYMGVNGAGVAVTWFYIDDGAQGPMLTIHHQACARRVLAHP